MRMAFGMAALVTCLAAQPATAREEPAFRGDAPAPTAAFAPAASYQPAAVFQLASPFQPFASFQSVAPFQPAASFQNAGGLPLAGDFRLHATIDTAQPASITTDDRLRHRVASAMMDLYPVAGSGFHLSGGMRMFARNNFMAEAEKFTNGLLFAPHGMGNSAMRTGFKRYTPAMTAGYTHMIQHDLSLGLEAGSLLGHAYSGIPGRLRTGAGGGSGAGLNPIMNLVVGARF